MKLGVFTVVFGDRPLEAALDRIVAAGLDCVEIGTGNYPGHAHCRPDELLADAAALKQFQRAISSRGLEISALSCHGNPLHPRLELARASHEVFVKTLKLAQQLGVGRVNLFSGCPGDSETARFPNWVTCAWPTEYGELLEWQWTAKVIPYWRDQAVAARQHGVRLGFEMHPGFVVYNPATLLRLREACGEAIGANLDPSHLFWQGIDIEAAIAELGKAAPSSTPMPRTPRSILATPASMASWTPCRSVTSAGGRGCFAPSATVTANWSGVGFSARCEWPATTTCCRSNTKTHCSPSTKVFPRPWPCCAV